MIERRALLNTISQIDNKLLDSNESNLIQHLLFGDRSKDREANTKTLNATVKRLRDLMNDSFKNVMFDKMLRLIHPYSLLYRDLLLFILYFVIFHSQIPLFGIWRLYIFSLNVHVSVYNHYIEKKYIYISSEQNNKPYNNLRKSKERFVGFWL